jgi:TPP-dependent 2-oxoacid decarboxylase
MQYRVLLQEAPMVRTVVRHSVKTEGELEEALKKANAEPDSLALVEVRLDKFDCSEALKKLGKALRK